VGYGLLMHTKCKKTKNNNLHSPEYYEIFQFFTAKVRVYDLSIRIEVSLSMKHPQIIILPTE